MERYEALARSFFEAADRANLSPPGLRMNETMRGEAAVMRLLMREGRSLTPGEICRLLDMTSSRVAAVLAGLERKGIITRESDQADRRRMPASLTPDGETICRRRQQHAVADFAALLCALGEEDATQFVRILLRVLALPKECCAAFQEGDELKQV